MAAQLPPSSFPFIQGVRWFNVAVLTVTPSIAVWGLLHVPFQARTLLFAAAYYIYSMLGITAGYHRLWSHRSYTASFPLQCFLLFGGTSAVQGSCFWWARTHRSHHRHTDTDFDPYNAKRGLFWTHVGWMLFKTNLRSGSVDASDLRNDTLLQWQHTWYMFLAAFFGYLLPTLVPGIGWGDWLGGFCFSGMLRLTIAHHSTFCINSVAHYLGSTPYDDALTPRDHFLSAILTMGEGYHNFHHQFPMDYRNAFRWYQYDPTKWFIAICNLIGLAANLRVFPSNEIDKGVLTMKLKDLKREQDRLKWPVTTKKLPVVTWETFQKEAEKCPLLLISGFIHDVSLFVDQHPGGRSALEKNSGRDMTAAFFGGVYSHSHAAHNLLSMMRVGVLDGGVEYISSCDQPSASNPGPQPQPNPRPTTSPSVSASTLHAIPPSQRLFIAERTSLP
ncbi:hypothetical protein PC9H_001998 [Pleurotus ostreatus]|uniref:Acyl-CoA desaturase n=1 Tax=Pleurotus ostreatus TaxID=5322 RepID=A0A8H7DNT5_PLEOS|nr:uncharacterized protein PC9H_001998 [Pleurotus ostreatus]KAF7419408.1 hypothetical protein PC9H_001998 [Pleurotus ostreatus]KAJ8689797.1 hypothetical protein PTI98_012659 [Pleurotus ostreatus]